MTERFVVLGIARPRAQWLAQVGLWASTATLPIELVRCVSLNEARARLHSGQNFSAILIDEHSAGLDRDVFGDAKDARCTAIIVGNSGAIDWQEIGAAAQLSDPFTPEELLKCLDALAFKVGPTTRSLATEPTNEPISSRLIAVTGTPGSGTSTTAMVIAHHLANDGIATALIDASRHGDQAMLNELGDVVPGLQEIVEAHRTGSPTPADIQQMLWPTGNGVDVVAGLRRHKDWTTLRRRSTVAAIQSIRRIYAAVIADIDDDLEGEKETGSLDVEDRNFLTREFAATADVVVVTSRAGTLGLHRLIRHVDQLLNFGVEGPRLVPIIIGAPRVRSERISFVRTFRSFLAEMHPETRVSAPALIPMKRDIEPFLKEGAPLPHSLSTALISAFQTANQSLPSRAVTWSGPELVTPGHMGWSA